MRLYIPFFWLGFSIVVSQFFVTEAENEYVIRANSAIMKCKIPSFVSEFVYVDQWVADDGTIYRPGEQEYGTTLWLCINNSRCGAA